MTSSLPATRTPATGKVTVVLLGNPNTGKTTLFNALSGLRQRVGNYPGVTVETKKGVVNCDGRTFDLIDLPGTYSLAARSPDEMVAVDVILGQQPGEPSPDVLLCIVDASNLERNLYLTSQVLELGLPVVLALNMTDVAQSQGLRINTDLLAEQLGVRVVPIQANRKKGLDQLRQALVQAAAHPTPPACPPFPDALEHEVTELHRWLTDAGPESDHRAGQEVAPFLVRRLILDVGGYTEERLCRQKGQALRTQVQEARQRLAQSGCPVPAVEARARYTWIRQLLQPCVQRPTHKPISWTDRIDRVLTHRVWGTLLFLGLMFLVFQSIYSWAGPLMDLVDSGKEALAGLVAGMLPRGPFTSLLVDGVIEGVGSVLIFLPQILILFTFIALLEDCGYMARVAFLMDKLMARCGLSGKSFIPMLSSVACAVPGIMAARVIEDRRDRLATILVAPLMSCSARLPVYLLLIGAFIPGLALLKLDLNFLGIDWALPLVNLQGMVLFSMYLIGLVVAPLVALALKRSLLHGPRPVFVMEMPTYKWPALGTVVRRVYDSGWAFVRRAGTIILASMVVVWALLYFPTGHPDGGVNYPERIALLSESLEKESLDEAESARRQKRMHELEGEWKRQSLLGRAGKAIEPIVRPLGWDWRVGVAALASFPAREVVVGTLGIIYNLGEVDAGEVAQSEDVANTDLGQALQKSRWDDAPEKQVFTIPMALGLMVFFALCCQCASTLAVIYRETGSWRWPVFTFVYMTALAYLGALVVNQVGQWFI